jgi:hypothetical protein
LAMPGHLSPAHSIAPTMAATIDTAAAPVCAFAGAAPARRPVNHAPQGRPWRVERLAGRLIPFATSVMAALGVCTSSSRFVSLMCSSCRAAVAELGARLAVRTSGLWSASADRPSRSTRCGSPSRSPDTHCPQPNAAELVVSHVVPLVEGKRRELDRRDVCPGGPTGQRRAPTHPSNPAPEGLRHRSIAGRGSQVVAREVAIRSPPDRGGATSSPPSSPPANESTAASAGGPAPCAGS